jgi:hypothetical protein
MATIVINITSSFNGYFYEELFVKQLKNDTFIVDYLLELSKKGILVSLLISIVL